MVKNFFDLSGRVALVTGASRGLGQYLGRALAEAGADLIVTARRKEDTDAFAREIRDLGRRVESFSLNLRDETSIRAFGEAAPGAAKLLSEFAEARKLAQKWQIQNAP